MAGFKALLFGMAVVAVACVIAVGQEDGDADVGTGLKPAAQRLQDVNVRIESVRGEMDRANRDYARARHELVYTNTPAGKLYGEIRAIEEDLAEKRKRLSRLLQESPRMQELSARRKKLYEELGNLRERERLIRNEIKAEKFKKPAPQEDE